MKKQVSPGALLSPVPAVLISCGTMEKPNLLTVAWAGTVCTRPPMVSISIRPERFSYPLIKESGEFVLNLPPAKIVRAVDLCGVKSGKDGDKFALSGLHPVSAAGVSAPAVAECPVSFSCKVKQVIPLGSHDLFIAEIAAVEAEEGLFDEKGKLCLEKMGLLGYAHGEYYALGEKIGSFGFSVRKKPLPKAGKPARPKRPAPKPAARTGPRRPHKKKGSRKP